MHVYNMQPCDGYCFAMYINFTSRSVSLLLHNCGHCQQINLNLCKRRHFDVQTIRPHFLKHNYENMKRHVQYPQSEIMS